jgi:transposase-like protein
MMVTRATPPKASLKAKWSKLVSDYTQSGLSRTGFCREQGISPSALYQWQKYLSGEIEVPYAKDKKRKVKPQVVSGFVPMAIEPEERRCKATEPRLDIGLPSGLVLQFYGQLSGSFVKELINEIK